MFSTTGYVADLGAGARQPRRVHRVLVLAFAHRAPRVLLDPEVVPPAVTARGRTCKALCRTVSRQPVAAHARVLLWSNADTPVWSRSTER